MDSTRRRFVSGLAAMTSASLLSCSNSLNFSIDSLDFKSKNYPTLSRAYLDNAARHPMTIAAGTAVGDYVSGLNSGYEADVSSSVRAKFASLINANNNEITYAPSTTLGENLITAALGMPSSGGHIITDALHFIGSFYLYEQLKRQGMDITILPVQEDGTISPYQYEQAITEETVLIAVSHISWINGFEHDLKSLSDVAHAAGAFLYVNNLLLDRLQRPWYGYLQTANFVAPETHMYPLDPPGNPQYSSSRKEGIEGIFNGSFPPRMIEAAADVSLQMILETGVEFLQSQRQPLINALQTTLRERGFRPYTPAGSKSPIVSFIRKNSESFNERLAQANISISTYSDRFRISPSFYNDMNDIDRVIEVIGKA